METSYTGQLTVRSPKIFMFNLPKGVYEVTLTAYDGGEIGYNVNQVPNGFPDFSAVWGVVSSNSSKWTPSLPKEVKDRFLNKSKNKR